MNRDSQEQFAAILRPNPTEADDPITEIEGEIPRELNGTLYRNGPCQRTLPKAGARALHLFDGDGLVHAIRFSDGEVRHKSRFARTESFVREQEEGRYCMGGLNLPAEGPLDEEIPPFQPNTNVVFHAGRLFAMVENAPPFELDPSTLESKGFWRYDGRMVGLSTTAHPKIDGRTGQMVIHGYQPVEPYVGLYVVEADGSVSLAENVEAPWPSMMHDVAITENYVILPLGSLFFDVQPFAEGGTFNDAMQARTDLPLSFGVRRREPGSPIRWIEAPSPGYIFHPGNAYEKDGRIFMDACTYEDPAGLLAELATVRDARMGTGFVAHPYLYEIDPEAGTCKERKLADSAAEFPRIDDRRVGYENRFGYAATAEPSADGGAEAAFRRITRYDRTGAPSVHREAVPGQWVGEPVFVPRGADAAEDDGFVLALVYDATRDRSAVEILDARGVDREPLARLWTRERIPLGFHGNWAPATS